MFFIIMDAHSKWPEVVMMSSATALFTHFGLPEQLVLENGLQFTFDEFAEFMKGNGIKHILSSPYHPSSNGLAEQFFQTFKRVVRAGERDRTSLHRCLAEFLFSYCSSTQETTNVFPSELFLQQKLRTRFDLLKPDIKVVVELRQAIQKEYHDKHSKVQSLFIGSIIMVRYFRQPS